MPTPAARPNRGARLTGRPGPFRPLPVDGRDECRAAIEPVPPTSTGVVIEIDVQDRIDTTLGQATAKSVMEVVAARLAHNLRPTDTLTADGSGGFTAAVDGAGTDWQPGDTEQLCARLIDALDEPFQVDGRSLWITITARLAAPVIPETLPAHQP